MVVLSQCQCLTNIVPPSPGLPMGMALSVGVRARQVRAGQVTGFWLVGWLMEVLIACDWLVYLIMYLFISL